MPTRHRLACRYVPVTALEAADGRDIRDEIAMDALRRDWFEHYDIGYAANWYLARRLNGGPLLTAGTPAGLESAIRADWARFTANDAR